MSIAVFVDPLSKEELSLDSSGNLCNSKSRAYESHDGCYDFVTAVNSSGSEKKYYDNKYKELAPMSSCLPLHSLWTDVPWYSSLLESLGTVEGKRILLLGNGTSQREFYFAEAGAKVVYTDLSIQAVLSVRDLFLANHRNYRKEDNMEFHAVDAYHLPFGDCSFDIIYGSAFVHHLSELDQFFREVYRCLDERGICRFFDQADSPLWDTMKSTFLRPLQKHSYRKYPRSPEDLNANDRKVFNRKSLCEHAKKHGFRELYFQKNWFFLPIFWRHYGKSVRWNADMMSRVRKIHNVLMWTDCILSKTQFMKRNSLMLIWGFNK